LSPATPKARAAWVLYWVTRHQSVFGVRELSDARREAIALFREAGDVVGLSCALRSAGIALARPGERSGKSLQMLEEAITLVRPLGKTKDLANALAHLGGFYYINDDEERARELSEEALLIRRTLGDKTGELVSCINLGEFAFVRGESWVAIEYATKALIAVRQSPVQEVLATVLANLANYLLSVDNVASGRAAAEEALAIYRALGTPDYAVGCLEHLALALALEGSMEQAANLFGFTSAYFAHTEQVRDRPEQIRCNRLREELATAMTEAQVALSMAEGSAWSTEQAEDAALRRRVEGATKVSFATSSR